MNLTSEELQFFQAQRLAASADVIAFNFTICEQLLAVIPVQQLPDPCFPVPLAIMNHGELNALKDKLVEFYDDKNCYAQMTSWPLPLHRQYYRTSRKQILCY